MLIRFIRSGFFLLLLVGVSASAAELTVTALTTGWRDAASFKRISEYFTGRENVGDQTICRTQPTQRAGYYFLVRTEQTAAPVTVQIVVQLIMPTRQPIRTRTFTAELKTGKTLLQLGLTGDDWPAPTVNPVAWKIDISTPDGRLLASDKSYLWDKPPGE